MKLKKKKNSPATILMAVSIIGAIAYLIDKGQQSKQATTLVAQKASADSQSDLQSLHSLPGLGNPFNERKRNTFYM